MPEDRKFAHFIEWMGASVVGGAVLVTVFVILVDPYRIYRLVEISGVNIIKPAPERYQQELKTAAARAVGANVFLMGNSRVEVGLNPDDIEFAGGKRSPYNLAVAGSGVGTAHRQFEALRVANPPSVLVLGVEFLDFLVDQGGADLPVQPKGLLERVQWKIDTVFSLNAFLDALKTLQIQHSDEASTMTARGFNPLKEYRGYVRQQGYHSIFRQRAEESAKSIGRKPHGLVRANSGTSSDWQELRALLDGAASERAEIHLVIYPYHAQIMAMFEQAGLWPAFEQWKSLLVREVERTRQMHPGVAVTLWDFSGFGPIQCERIPAKGDLSSAPRWYWEAGHFKSALGDLVLERMLGGGTSSTAPAGLGIALDAQSFDENRFRIARERAACAASYPDLFKEVAALIPQR